VSLPVKRLHVPREIKRPSNTIPGAQPQPRTGQGEEKEGQGQQKRQIMR